MSGEETVLERLAVMESRFDDMERVLQEIRQDVKASAGLYNGQQVVCAARGVELQKLTQQVDDHNKRLKVVEAVFPAVKIMIWVGAAFGLSIIALIWALITGQAAIVFK